MSGQPNPDVSLKPIESRILVLRGQKVILDEDLAELYGVTTKALNQAVKRNPARFPADFMFQISVEEWKGLRSQIVTASRRNIRYLPRAFSEFGALQAANVLNSPRAAEMGVFVVRAFVRLREAVTANQAIARKLAELEKRVGNHDQAIKAIIEAIRQLMAPARKKKSQIGFASDNEMKS